MQKIKQGMMVRVSGSLEKSYREFGRSPHDEMEGMKRRVFEVRRATDYKVVLGETTDSFGYSFHPDDLTIVDDKEPEPQIFEFDIRNLDI